MELRELQFRVARVGLHHYEEPFISGERGSGTIFFSGCDLRCLFCQNYEISRGGKGLNVDGEELLELMRYIAGEGAENINLVTPTIWGRRLAPVLEAFRREADIPIVWNSGGRDDVEMLRALDGIVDIYLPDYKYCDSTLAREYSGDESYPERAFSAIREMRRQRPRDIFSENGMMREGVCVRHLVLPSAVENTRGVMRRIAAIDRDMFVSVMGQYFPTPAVRAHPMLGRRLTESEYDEAIDSFFAAGLHNGFSQELDSATEEYVPDFSPEEVAKILHH